MKPRVSVPPVRLIGRRPAWCSPMSSRQAACSRKAHSDWWASRRPATLSPKRPSAERHRVRAAHHGPTARVASPQVGLALERRQHPFPDGDLPLHGQGDGVIGRGRQLQLHDDLLVYALPPAPSSTPSVVWKRWAWRSSAVGRSVTTHLGSPTRTSRACSIVAFTSVEASMCRFITPDRHHHNGYRAERILPGPWAEHRPTCDLRL